MPHESFRTIPGFCRIRRFFISCAAPEICGLYKRLAFAIMAHASAHVQRDLHAWVECCGHLSLFSVPPFRYSSSPSALPRWLERARTERSMATKIGAVFSHTGQKGTYDYDFGSTTRLTVERVGARVGRIRKRPVRLLV